MIDFPLASKIFGILLILCTLGYWLERIIMVLYKSRIASQKELFSSAVQSIKEIYDYLTEDVSKE
jgi:hypothetical protein